MYTGYASVRRMCKDINLTKNTAECGRLLSLSVVGYTWVKNPNNGSTNKVITKKNLKKYYYTKLRLECSMRQHLCKYP